MRVTRGPRRARGNSIVELMAAISLSIVLFPAVFPPIEGELRRTGELYEQESARLLVEGELTQAREDGSKGQLAVGSVQRSPLVWKSAARFDSLVLTRTVSLRPDGLLAVAVEARWRSRSEPGHPPERLELATWVAKP